MRTAAAAAVVLALWASGAAALEGPARVIDGDTIEVAGRTVRLHGIDAPEAKQRCLDALGEPYGCGANATATLRRLVGAHPVRCRVTGRDRWDRAIAVCHAGDRDLNAAMVSAGWALAFRRYSDAYVADEGAAARAGRGLWAGRFAAPWDWRRLDRPADVSRTARAPAEGCRIKGNVTGAGRIYHLPGSPSYDATRIDPSRGERWFCSEREARAAGFRPPRTR